MIGSTYPLLDIFWTMLEIFIFILWIWLLIAIFSDIFRSHDMGGWAKGLWVIFLVIFPLLGVLVYLIVRGGSMHERAAAQAHREQRAFDDYVKTDGGGRVAATWTSWPSWPISNPRASSVTRSSPRKRPSCSADGGRCPAGPTPARGSWGRRRPAPLYLCA